MSEQERRCHPGAAIRRLRKEKGWTQSVLCGEVISRNLLSQVETGKVYPSLQTMQYLADRLEVPISLFFLSDAQREVLEEHRVFPEIHRAWSEKRYADCLQLCASLPLPTDRVCYFRAEAQYRMGYDCYLLGKLNDAAKWFRMALDQRVHSAAAGAAEEMLARIRLILTDGMHSPLYSGDPLTASRDAAWTSLALQAIENGTVNGLPEAFAPLRFEDENLKHLVLAMLYAACERDSACRSEQISVKEKELSPAAALYYYRTAEECCVRMSDFATAYMMSKKREALWNKLKKSMEKEECK